MTFFSELHNLNIHSFSGVALFITETIRKSPKREFFAINLYIISLHQIELAFYMGLQRHKVQ